MSRALIRDDDAALVAQSALRFGTVGASLGLLAGGSWVGWSAALLTKNTATNTEREALLVCILVGTVLGLATGAIFARQAGGWSFPSLDRAGRIATPLALLALVPILGCTPAWTEQPITFLFVLVAFGLTLERTLRDALLALPSAMPALPTKQARARSRYFPLLIVLAASTAFSIWCAHYTLLCHRRLVTAAFDLGIYDNLMFNAMHGQFFRSPVLFGPQGGNYLAGHAEFVMLLFVPLYALRPGPEMLLVLQATLVGFAAVPLYFFARAHVGRWSAAAVAVCYLAYAPLHGPLFYDFHWILIAIPFHFTLYWALSTKRYGVAVAMCLVLYSVREDVAIGLTILGLFLLLTGKRVRFGVALAVISPVWFVVDKFGIMMHAGSWWFVDMYKELLPAGEHGYGGVVKTILSNPAYFVGTLLKENKLAYTLHLFAPIVFLPARRGALLPLAMPGFFLTLMTTAYAPTLSISFQYTTHWVPYLFGTTVLAIRLLTLDDPAGVIRRRAATVALMACVGLHTFSFGGFFQRGNFDGGFSRIRWAATAEEEADYASLHRVAAQIPVDASVSALEHLEPHASTRMTSYTLRDHEIDADYVLLKGAHMGFGSTRKVVEGMFKKSKYGLAARDGDIFLFEHGRDAPGTDAAMKALGIGTPPPVNP